jgi:hypothetical protein
MNPNKEKTIIFINNYNNFFDVFSKWGKTRPQVLPPYGPVLINRAKYISLLPFFRGWMWVWVCVKVSPRTACCCRKIKTKFNLNELLHTHFTVSSSPARFFSIKLKVQLISRIEIPFKALKTWTISNFKLKLILMLAIKPLGYTSAFLDLTLI